MSKQPPGFSRYLTLASRFIARGRVPALLLAVTRKGARLKSKGKLGVVQDDLRLLMSLCRAWVSGEYRQLNPQALLAVVAALLYFLSPVDVIPDWFIALGFLDDLAVLGWVIKRWHGELEAFKQWREQRQVEEGTRLLPEG